MYLLTRLTFVIVKLVIRFFHAHIVSRINYVSNVAVTHISKKLNSVHKRAVKVFCAASPMLTGQWHLSYGPLPLKEHLQYNKCTLVHKVIHNKSPQYLRQLVHTATIVHGTSFLFKNHPHQDEQTPFKSHI